MSHRKKRPLEQDHSQEGSKVKNQRTSLVSECLQKTPIVLLNDFQLDHVYKSKKAKVKKSDSGQRAHTEKQGHTSDSGSAAGESSPSPLEYIELSGSDINIINDNQQQQEGTKETASPPKERLKVPVVRLFRVTIQPESQERGSTSGSDREQHHDQDLQKREQGRAPCVKNTHTSHKATSKEKKTGVKSSRIKKSQLQEEERLSEPDREQDSDKKTAKRDDPRVCKTHASKAVRKMKQAGVKSSRVKKSQLQEEERLSELDHEQDSEKNPQKTDQQEDAHVNNTHTSHKTICREEQTAVKSSRLKKSQQLRKLDSDQDSDRVPAGGHSEDHGLTNPLLARNSVPPQTICGKRPVVLLMRLNIDPNNHLETAATEKDNNEDHHDHELSLAMSPSHAPPEDEEDHERSLAMSPSHVQPEDEEDHERSLAMSPSHVQPEDEEDHERSLAMSPLHVQPEDQEDHERSLAMSPSHVQPEDQEDSTDDSDQFDEQDLEMLSAYELARLKNIKKNEKFLNSLKLREVASSIAPSRPQKRILVKREMPQSDMAMRRSMRQQGIAPTLPPLDHKKLISKRSPIPPDPIKMIPINPVDLAAWRAFKTTWKTISTGKFRKPSSLKCKNLTSYGNRMKSLTLEKRAIVSYNETISSLAVHPSPTRTLLAAGDYAGHVMLWDMKNRSEGQYRFHVHSGITKSIAFSPSNPRHVLSLGSEGTMRCGYLNYSIFEEFFREENTYLSSFDFLSTNGSVLLVSHGEGKLSVVDRRTPSKTHEVQASLDMKCVRSVNVHPLQRDYCVVAGGNAARIYDVRQFNAEKTIPVIRLRGAGTGITSASFSPCTGKRIALCASDKIIRVYRASQFEKDLRVVNKIRYALHPKVQFAWDPKQENCFAQSVGVQRRIGIFHVKGEVVHSLSSPYITAKPSVVAIHPSRDLVAVGGLKVLYVWKKWKTTCDPHGEN